MKRAFLTLTLLVLVGTVAGVSYGQQLVYTPVNPSFGGSPFNASWLLSEAQAQNSFSAPASTPYNPYSTNPLDDFKNTLNRQILSQLSSELISKTFGESTPGHCEPWLQHRQATRRERTR